MILEAEERDDLDEVRSRIWFYEFELPDGSFTRADIPREVLHIHTSRRDKLRAIVEARVGPDSRARAIDFASHEGYFSIELAKHFGAVTGLEIRQQSIDNARLISSALHVDNIEYRQADLQTLPLENDIEPADLVLVYGLLYHVENPIHVLRLASRLCREHILIESQVSTFDLSGRIEDGHYRWQRSIEGLFTLAADYSYHREGGSTDLALIPSLTALQFLLRQFGFDAIEVLPSDPSDYEQFRRGSRVVVYGRKSRA
jgi:ubiquinone/menaquinone biosynthesis C-methylase UbiE